MAKSDPYCDYCLELLAGVGPCIAKRMFGGFGISREGMNFALIAFEQLWLKVDTHSEEQFTNAGCSRFSYEAKGKQMSLAYCSVPADAMDSAQAMLPWAKLGFDAAVRAHAAKQSKRRPANGEKPRKSEKPRK